MAKITLDAYIFDTLMRDLVDHGRSASAFLVYLFLARHTHGAARPTAAFSHAVLAENVGISKRAAQNAVKVLVRRRLLKSHRRAVTAVPVYTIMRPWADRGTVHTDRQ